MTWWLIVAPLREDDDALRTTRWIARVTAERVSPRPTLLLDVDARRARLSECLAVPPSPGGVAFFGHGSDDRLFDVDRAPEADGPSLLDLENIHTCKGWWVHAFACRSGARLARAAADAGVDVYVGYQRPLDAGWTPPHGAEEAVARLVTCTAAALAAGERDERALRRAASDAADALVGALEVLPDDAAPLFLYALAQQLVDMVVERA